MAERIIFDQAALDSLFRSPAGPVGKDLLKRALRVETEAKRSMSPGGAGKAHVPSQPGRPPAVDTGRLRASITHDMGSDSAGLVARVGTDVTYGRHLELGTSRMAARPFLRPALHAAGGGRP